MSTLENKRFNQLTLLAAATGYSAVYCKKVVNGDRSQTSKGGRVIMDKYLEFLKLINA